MRKLLKWTGVGVLGLLAATLLLVLAWVASNWHDAEPQPWPEALTPRAMPVAEADNFFVALMAVPNSEVKAAQLTLPACDGANCAAIWASAAPHWPAQRHANATLGHACEAATRNEIPAFAEPLPVTFSFDVELPRFQPLIQCSYWLVTLALEASAAKNPDAALAKLAQSARLSTAAYNGSQSLLGHMMAVAVWTRHLQALQVVAAQHPRTVPALQALPLPTAAQAAAAQRRWIAYESNFSRSAVRAASPDVACKDSQGLSAPICRALTGLSLPNYGEQLFSEHWQAVLSNIRDDALLNAVNSAGEREAVTRAGLLGSQWHWRGTVPHLLFNLGLPAYESYLARSANLILSAQATTLWLRAYNEPAAARSAWLTTQVNGTPLDDRLSIDSQGQWQLRALDSNASNRNPPTRWPAWPA